MVKSIVISSISFSVVRWGQHGQLVPVYCIVEEELFNLCRYLSWVQWLLSLRVNFVTPLYQQGLEHREWSTPRDLSKLTIFIELSV